MAGQATYQQPEDLLTFITAQDTMNITHFTTTSTRRLSLERVAKAVKAVNPFRLSKRSLYRQLDNASRSSLSYDVHIQYDCAADGVWALAVATT